MIIPHALIKEVAPDVTPKAQERKGQKSPFISLQSLELLCQGDETLEASLKEMVILSLRYAETLCRFAQIVSKGQQSNEDDTRKEIETVRGRIHDATIDSINLLSRLLKKSKKDISWMDKVSIEGRSSYGKFATILAFEAALEGGQE